MVSKAQLRTLENANKGIYSSGLRLQNKVTPPTILTSIGKRKINLIPQEGRTIFNRHSELQIYNNEKLKPTRFEDITAGYAPNLEITPVYIKDLPEHLKNCNIRTKIQTYGGEQESNLLLYKYIHRKFDGLIESCLNKILYNKTQLENFIKDGDLLVIYKIKKASWPRTFVEFCEQKLNYSSSLNFESKFNNFTAMAHSAGVENFQFLNSSFNNNYLVSLKNINIEDVIPLVVDTIYQLTYLDRIRLLTKPVDRDSVLSALDQAFQALSFIS